MHKNLNTISTVGMSREAWLSHRRNSIGGSDAAAILGLNSYSSPYTVWADKMGILPPKEDNEAMRLGRDLEDYVAQRFCEASGKKVRRWNAIITNPRYPWAHANVDRMIVGEDAGLECKTTSVLNLKKFKDGEYPANYYVQCVHYMACTGAARWYLGVLILGVGFRWFVIERDEEEIAALMKSEEEFWRYVESKTEPPADGSEPTMDSLQTIYPDSNGETMDLFGYQSSFDCIAAVEAQIKELEGIRDQYKAQIMQAMGDVEKGICGDVKVSWKTQTRSSFDATAYAKDHPDEDLSPYFKQSKFRAFKITRSA